MGTLVLESARDLAADVLDQTASARDGHQLLATADSEQRQAAPLRLAGQVELEPAPDLAGWVYARHGRLAVPVGRDVEESAAEQQTARAPEGVRRVGLRHARPASGALDPVGAAAIDRDPARRVDVWGNDHQRRHGV
jgi:hypothetical protein